MSDLQRRAFDIAVDVFGPEAMYSVEERALRFFEEACELTRKLGITQEKMQEIFDFEWSRPIGYSTIQEIGGAGGTLMSVAQVCNTDLLECIELEMQRVKDNKEHIQRKAALKPAHVHAVAPQKVA